MIKKWLVYTVVINATSCSWMIRVCGVEVIECVFSCWSNKTLSTFWENKCKTMKLTQCDVQKLSKIQSLVRNERPERKGLWNQHENASCHRSRLTQGKLCRPEIKTIVWPPYSPDINLIEQIWAKMKTNIQDQYSMMDYDPRRVELCELHRIILEA